VHQEALAELREHQQRQAQAREAARRRATSGGGSGNPLQALLDAWRAAARERQLLRRARAARRARTVRTLLLEWAPCGCEGGCEGDAGSGAGGSSNGSRNGNGNGSSGGCGTSSGGGGGAAPRLLGYASLCVTQPGAALPPPLPSGAPYCVYLSGLAVAPGCRRAGAGRALLRAAGALGARWGARGLWLHARAGNYPALGLYRSEGFRTVAVVGPPWGRQNLMRLPLSPRAAADGRSGSGDSDSGSGGGAQERRGGGEGADAATAEAAAAEGGAPARGGRVYVWGAARDPPGVGL
jgi:hypothetical protein